MSEKWNPFDILKDIPCPDEKFFRDISGQNWHDPLNMFSKLRRDKWPPLNLEETPGEIVVTVDIPGLRKAGDVSLTVSGNSLILEGELHRAEATREIKFHQRERREGKFSRSVPLPSAVEFKSARATYSHGILEIRLAKKEQGLPREININFTE